MEQEVFALAEVWHIGPQEILKLPWSRRQRMLRMKSELEEKRAKAHEQAMSEARARSKRRR